MSGCTKSSFSEPSPPITITTSAPASSTIATALSTAAWAMSAFPSARAARIASEFGAGFVSASIPYFANRPFISAATTGSGRPGKLVSRIFCGPGACAPANIWVPSRKRAPVPILQRAERENFTGPPGAATTPACHPRNGRAAVPLGNKACQGVLCIARRELQLVCYRRVEWGIVVQPKSKARKVEPQLYPLPLDGAEHRLAYNRPAACCRPNCLESRGERKNGDRNNQ